MIELLCPTCGMPLDLDPGSDPIACRCGRVVPRRDGVLDLVGSAIDDPATASHYTCQWDVQTGIGDFLKQNPAAAALTPGKQLGWPDLFERIRAAALRGPTLVYDAACGFGGIFADLFADPAPPQLDYLGADIHHALGGIALPKQAAAGRARFVRWDISRPLPTSSRFDYVLCRAAIHHTPDPERTFDALVARTKPGGVIALSAYARKTPMREAVDDALRATVGAMSAEDALVAAHQFTALGQALQACPGTITIPHDLPLLGIRQGTYGVQEFLYDHFLKCWYGAAFGSRYSDVVNFDWYHPTYAFRYALEELVGWFEKRGLEVRRTASIKAQHYVEGVAG